MAVQLTSLAGAALAEAQRESNFEEGRMMRLTPVEGKIALEGDWPHEDDRVIEHDGSPILAVDPQVDEQLADMVIDVGSGDMEGALVIRPAQ